MKRRELVRHLQTNGCEVLREGGRHTVFVNRANRKVSTVPRHNDKGSGLFSGVERAADAAAAAVEDVPRIIEQLKHLLRPGDTYLKELGPAGGPVGDPHALRAEVHLFVGGDDVPNFDFVVEPRPVEPPQGKQQLEEKV